LRQATIEDDDFTDDITDDDPLIDPDEDLEDSAIIDQVKYNKRGVTKAVKELERGTGYAKLKRLTKKPRQKKMWIRDVRIKIRNKVIDRIKIIRASFAASQKATVKQLIKLTHNINRQRKESFY